MNIKIYNFIRKNIRYILGIRPNESYEDGLERIYYHYRKKFPYKHVTLEELNRCFDELGINEGDVLVIHSAWRAMYMLDMTPSDFLDFVIQRLGPTGTIVMPCYGSNSKEFDADVTSSNAGVLSELLRLRPNSRRSVFPKFSMVALGKEADQITKYHYLSRYQFDDKSPYSILVQKYNAKILLIGLGKKPHKISVFHCASYATREFNQYYGICYSNIREACVIDANGQKQMKYIDRLPVFQNDKRCFRKLFKKVRKKQVFIKGLNCFLFFSKDAYDVAFSFCENGGKIYKKIR